MRCVNIEMYSVCVCVRERNDDGCVWISWCAHIRMHLIRYNEARTCARRMGGCDSRVLEENNGLKNEFCEMCVFA